MILVGEMRDLETIGTALTAAETGHLVFATLHTQDAPQTIDRIIDVFPPEQQGQIRVQLSIALQGVVTQKLLPTADGAGRCVACEVLVPTPAVRNLIREGKIHQIPSLIQTGAAHGMQTMDAALATLVRAGQITQELAESRSSPPEELRRLLGGVALGRMSTFVFKAMDVAGAPMRGQVDADSKQAVSDQLKARGLIVLDIAEKHRSREINLTVFERIKLSDLTIISRQLATMVSSGMTILRALFVLEEQTENEKLQGRSSSPSARTSRPASPSATRSPGTRRSSARCTSRWSAPARSAACSRTRSTRVADQLEKDDALRRQVKLGDGLPVVVAHRRALRADRPDRLHRPGLRRRAQGVRDHARRRLAAGDHPDHGRRLPRGHRLLVHLHPRRRRHRLRPSATGRRSESGRPQWDRLRLKIPFKIGDIVQKIAIARWSRTFSALSSAGVPIIEAIEITGQTAGNAVVNGVWAT